MGYHGLSLLMVHWLFAASHVLIDFMAMPEFSLGGTTMAADRVAPLCCPGILEECDAHGVHK